MQMKGRHMSRIIRLLDREDRMNYFNKPVDETFAPGYYDIIKNPTDIATIAAQVLTTFTTAEHTIEQIARVYTNAMRYNPPGHPVHDEARRLLSYLADALEGDDRAAITMLLISYPPAAEEEASSC